MILGLVLLGPAALVSVPAAICPAIFQGAEEGSEDGIAHPRPNIEAPIRSNQRSPAPTSWVPTLRDRSGQYSLKLRGRLVVDVTNFTTGIAAVSAANAPIGTAMDFQRVTLRDARIGIEGDLPLRLRYRGEVQFASDGSVIFNDVFVEHVGDGFALNLGNTQLVAPIGQASALLTFETLERPTIARAFGLGRGLGIVVQKWRDAPLTGYALGAGWYGLPLSVSGPTGLTGPWSAATRAVWVPVRNARTLVNLGGTFRYRAAHDGPDLRFRARSSPGPGLVTDFIDTNFSDLSPETARQLPQFRSDRQYFLEATLVRGPWSLQSEFGLADARSADATGARAQFTSFNLQTAWIFTGESRAAAWQPRFGRLGRSVPAAPIDRRGPGLWGGHFRIDHTDLDDGSVTGGRQTIATLGINWQPVWNVRVGLEAARSFIDTRSDLSGAGGSEARGFRGETTSLVTRIQTDW